MWKNKTARRPNCNMIKKKCFARDTQCVVQSVATQNSVGNRIFQDEIRKNKKKGEANGKNSDRKNEKKTQ